MNATYSATHNTYLYLLDTSMVFDLFLAIIWPITALPASKHTIVQKKAHCVPLKTIPTRKKLEHKTSKKK